MNQSSVNLREESPRTPIRIFIVDDHPVVADGLAALAARAPDLMICGRAAELESAWKLLEELRPDVVVVDLSLKGANGLDLVKRSQAGDGKVPILIWSVQDEAVYGERALRAGARGYITKDRPTQEVIAAIRAVHAGQLFASDALKQAVMNPSSTRKSVAAEASPIRLFSDRELQVFQAIGEGRDNRWLAEHTGLSVKTIETYRQRLKDKLNITSGTELVRQAVEWVTLNRQATAPPAPSP